jgi:subtilisin family serine protease
MVLVLMLSGVTLAQDVKVTRIEGESDIASFVGYVQDEFIIVFKQGVKITPAISPEGIAAIGVPDFDTICRKHAVSRIRKQFRGSQGGQSSPTRDLARYYKVKFDKGKLEETMAAYRSHPLVDHVEPIGIHTTHSNPNDYHFPYQWYLNSTSYPDINASEAWDIETGSGDVIVAILDTGVRYFHKDLGGSDASLSTPENALGNMWINWDEKNGTAGSDDEDNGFGNGYIDDWIGWDFVNNIPNPANCYPVEGDVPGEDCSGQDNDPRDFNGHGTEMAGIVAAITNNGYSVAGIAGGWGNGTLQPGGNGVKIMACRIGWSELNGQSEISYVQMDFAAEALCYAADNGARIAICSWGSSESGGIIGAAVDYFLAGGGRLIFKSAGNGGSETDDYLCINKDVICVAATDEFDCKAPFSRYGDCIDISAPGFSIMTTTNKHNDPENDYDGTGNSTSMATAVAAGVAALIWSRNPGRTATQVKDILYSTADDIESLTCNVSYAGKLGAGRVNAYNAVAKCLTDVDCDDSNMCTDDVCNTDYTCSHNQIVCPGGWVCSRGTCVEQDCEINLTCEIGEDCNSCSDCFSGISGAECGNQVCETGKGEDCISCPDDCQGKITGSPNYRYCCGDGTAAYGVTCTDGRCSGGGYSCTTDPGTTWCCGDGVCEGPEHGGNCGIDCGIDCGPSGECDDVNECILGVCIDSVFCQNTPVNDIPCSGGICCGGTCTPAACSSDSDCDDGEICTDDTCDNGGTCSASCTNTWPACGGSEDDCCGPSCTSANDPDCVVQDCTPCFKKKCDGICDPKKEDTSCPDC